MSSKFAPRLRRWLWVVLLPLPAMVGHAESGDPQKTMAEISKRAAKGDRLPVAYRPDAAWTSCPPRVKARSGVCATLTER